MMAMVSRHGPVANRIDPGRIYNSEREERASRRISKKGKRWEKFTSRGPRGWIRRISE